MRPVWFSDGGIGSNFPIHFFDALTRIRRHLLVEIELVELRVGIEIPPQAAAWRARAQAVREALDRLRRQRYFRHQDDCAFPLLAGMSGTSDAKTAFQDADVAMLVAGVNDHLEIWDRAAWNDHVTELEGSAEDVAERLAAKRD